jgi:hypothetical protein
LKVFELLINTKPMPQNIYFGNAMIKNTKTGQTQTVERVVFKDGDNLQDINLRSNILRGFKPKERDHIQIEKLCFDTAKNLGVTSY